MPYEQPLGVVTTISSALDGRGECQGKHEGFLSQPLV